jgi:hypothetical protein
VQRLSPSIGSLAAALARAQSELSAVRRLRPASHLPDRASRQPAASVAALEAC